MSKWADRLQQRYSVSFPCDNSDKRDKTLAAPLQKYPFVASVPFVTGGTVHSPDIQDFINDVDERVAFLKHCASDFYKTTEAATAAAYLEVRNSWLNRKKKL